MSRDRISWPVILVIIFALLATSACQSDPPASEAIVATSTPVPEATAQLPTKAPASSSRPALAPGPVIDDFEGGDLDHWWSDIGGSATSLTCAPASPGHEGAQAMQLTFEIGADGYAGCGTEVPPAQWGDASGLRFLWRADQPGLTVSVGVAVQDPAQTNGDVTPFHVELPAPGDEWAPVTLAWDDLAKPEWIGQSGVDTLDPAHIVGLSFYVNSGQRGAVWVDTLQLMGEGAALAEAANPTPAPTARLTDSETATPVTPPPTAPETVAPLTPTPLPVSMGETIVIDHTCTDLSKIPDEWIQEAAKLTFHLAHTSHGSQILSGVRRLAEVDPRYNVAIQDWDPAGLPDAAGALRIYDGNNWDGDNYITPEMYWGDEEGKNRTRSVAGTGLFNFSMWSWCGQQSDNSASDVNRYLETLNQFESAFPNMRFIYMSGHSDGTVDATLARNNQMVRDYVNAHGKVLFDFEDIDSHDPAGNYYPNNEEGECTWCDAWCDAHPDDCTDLPYDCAHSESTEAQKLNCKLKGNAFWWMMARLAGWEGITPPSN